MDVVKKCNYCGKTYPSNLSFCLDDGKPLVEVETMVGRLIDGRYRLDSLIGKGGMGDVYQATHVHLDSEFAVKLLKPEFVANETAIRRFRLEARAAGRIQHPNAIRVTDFGVSPENIVYLVMDLINGYSLRSLMNDGKPIDFIRTVNIARQICGAVDAAHRSGVIHRDIKPDNILIEKVGNNERVKVLDFGIAKLRETKATDRYLTQAGTIIGTPQYMSPEQCQGKEIDARSDIYSIGIILYEMLAGHVPFDAVSTLQVVQMQLHDKPQPLSEAAPHVSEALARVVCRALEKDPANRPTTALELSDELKEAVESSGGRAIAAGLTDPLIPPPVNASTSSSNAPDTGESGRVTAIEQNALIRAHRLETPPTLIKPENISKWRLPLLALIGVSILVIAGVIIFMNGKPEEKVKPVPRPATVPEGMVKIEGGKFLMGRNDGAPDEGPAHEVEIKTFLLDIREVTNQDYKKFVDATGRRAPRHWGSDGSFAPAEALYPVTYVTWEDATAYAGWAGKRLPSEAEWEYAARGGKQDFIYPWGSEWRAGYANIDNKTQPRPAPVRSYVKDVSPFGVYDMAGNASEWVQDHYSIKYGARPDTRLRVYRGGNFLDPPEKSTNTFRWSDFPSDIPEDQIVRVGFRCAKDIE
ncbi:MAG: SUMF1/EgtB/PvdO family nonheme iron enzyme [Acidobacteriota bacterium]|nr:MAG: SUMF1/EgtB/PvdO family nonheme iron enzyme [Acidobacteriota bacterium]